MIRSLIALFVALFFALASIIPPVYADTTTLENSSQVKDAQWSIFWIKPEDVGTFMSEVVHNSGAAIETVGSSIPFIEIKPENVQAFMNEVVRNGGEVIGTVGSSISSIKINPEYMDEFIKGLVNGSGKIIGIVGTGVIICYTADGVATTVFPPAAALAPYCSAASTIGTNIIAKRGVQMVVHLVFDTI